MWNNIPHYTQTELRSTWPCINHVQFIDRTKLPNVDVNVAYRSKAEQSSRFGSAEEFGAHKATDGPLLSVPAGLTPDLASCTRTKRQKDPFIVVELDEVCLLFLLIFFFSFWYFSLVFSFFSVQEIESLRFKHL